MRGDHGGRLRGQAVWKRPGDSRAGRFRPGGVCFRILKLAASGVAMHRFIDGEDRMQPALLPHTLEDYVGEENPVRVFGDDAGGDRSAGLSSLDAAEDLPLRLSQPRAVEPAA